MSGVGRLPPVSDPSFIGKLQAALEGLQSAKQTRNSPIQIPAFTVATMPSPSEWLNTMIIVTNASVGYTPAFSDGTVWRSTIDGNPIS